MKFSISERYRLELHWSKVVYDQEGVARLFDSYFAGPVLTDVEEMNQEDKMPLDFANQYVVFIPRYYIATLSWKGVRQTPERIYLSNTILKNAYLNSVPKLKNDDYILIDTTNHVDNKHHFHLVYPSYLLNSEGEFYSFGGK